jgi:hypothetical protein
MYPREWIVDSTRLRRFQRRTLRRLAFVPFTITWDGGLAFPLAEVTELWRDGWIPLVRIVTFPTLDYAPNAPPSPGPTPMSTFLTGAHDQVLREWARAARRTEIPIGVDLLERTTWPGAARWGGTTGEIHLAGRAAVPRVPPHRRNLP